MTTVDRRCRLRSPFRTCGGCCHTGDAWTASSWYRLYEDRHRTMCVGETQRRSEAEAAPYADRMWARPISGWSSTERRIVPCVGFEAAWVPAGTEPRTGVVNLEHARDIPDAVFCRVVAAVMDRQHRWANRWEIATELEARGFAAAPIRSGRPQDAVPWKLVLAKGRRLIDRKLIDGCVCGCRGDFELTDAGRAFLEASEAS